MDMVKAVILGLVQGLGEFLPISSSAHLVLIPWFMRWTDSGLTFDIALHVGTLLAVVIYFWKDWIRLLHQGFANPREREGKLFWYLVLATIPGALIGFVLEDVAETVFRHPVLIACMLMVLGIILYAADRRGQKQIEVETISLQTSFLIGLSQALAIIPGVSRSGVTMTAALALGMGAGVHGGGGGGSGARGRARHAHGGGRAAVVSGSRVESQRFGTTYS